MHAGISFAPDGRQIYVSAIAFGSVLWLIVLVGVAFPVVGTFLLSFVPLPDWVDKKWVRLAMRGAGYPYTVGLAHTLVMMTVFAPIIEVRTLAKRWTSEHVPVLEPNDDAEVVDAAQRALEAGGFETDRRRASWLLRAPTKIPPSSLVIGGRSYG